MQINPEGFYMLLHVVDDHDEVDTHLVVDLVLAGRALDALVVSFINMLDTLPGAFQAHKTEFRTGVEQEAAILLDDNLIDGAFDEIEEEHGGYPAIRDAITGQQLTPDMDIAVVCGRDLQGLLQKLTLDEWEDPYQAQIVLRSDETGHDAFLFVEIQSMGFRESQVNGRSIPFHYSLHGNAGYWKWSDVRRKIPMNSL